MAARFASIDEYISSYPEEIQTILQGVRRAICKAVPEPGEAISYQMPTITLNGRSLVYFAAWKQHIGMYPIPRAEGGTRPGLPDLKETDRVEQQECSGSNRNDDCRL